MDHCRKPRGECHLQIALEAENGGYEHERFGDLIQKGPSAGLLQQDTGCHHFTTDQEKRHARLNIGELK